MIFQYKKKELIIPAFILLLSAFISPNLFAQSCKYIQWSTSSTVATTSMTGTATIDGQLVTATISSNHASIADADSSSDPAAAASIASGAGVQSSEVAFNTNPDNYSEASTITISFDKDVIVSVLKVVDVDAEYDTHNDAYTITGYTFDAATGVGWTLSPEGTVSPNGVSIANNSAYTVPESSNTPGKAIITHTGSQVLTAGSQITIQHSFTTIGNLETGYAIEICSPDPCSQLSDIPKAEKYLTIACGATTIDLSSKTADRQPTGTSVSIHTGATATAANEVNAAAVSAGAYYLAFKNTANSCYSPTTPITIIPSANCNGSSTCTDLVAEGTNSGGQTGTISTTEAAIGGASYAITQNSISGYANTTYNEVDNEGGVRIKNFNSQGGSDAFSYTYAVTPNNASVVPQIRFYQSRGLTGGNNEASLYTISWVGGLGNATYYDNVTPACGIYESTYGGDCPPRFDISEREIIGTSTTGEIPNGGSFEVYMVKNNSTQWYVEFPKGATSVTVSKVVFSGANVGSGCGQPGYNVSCGIDSQWPLYGLSLAAQTTPGESFNEWITFDTKLIRPDCGTIKGSIFDDSNGLADATVNGTPTGKADSTPLYANLLDASGNVVSTVLVNGDGTYGFINIPSGSDYTVQISQNQGTEGAAAPATALPTGWSNTGENIGTGAGNDGTVDGKSAPINVTAGSITNDVNFGIQKEGSISGNVYNDTNGDANVDGAGLGNPDGTSLYANLLDASNKVVATVQVNANGSYNITGVPPGDYTVQVTKNQGTVNSLAPATELPTNWINTGENNGTTGNDGAADGKSATVSVGSGEAVSDVNFGIQKTGSISGTVFNDSNGLTDNTVNGTGLGNPSSTSLYANLLNASGNVVATVPVNADGTYNLTGLLPGDYTVQITKNQGTVNSAAPATELPTGWSNTGENNGTAAGSDGTVDGKSATVTIAAGQATSDVNFGIIPKYELELKATAPAGTVNVGQDIEFSVTVFNRGEGDISDVTIENTLPSALTPTASAPLTATVTATDGTTRTINALRSGNNYTLDFGANRLKVGESVVFNVPYKVNSGSASDTSNDGISNPFNITALDNDGDSGTAAPTEVGVASNSDTPVITAANVLPVELVEFIARANGCEVNLTWKTASEENFSHYEVEWSANGREFITIGKVEGRRGDVITEQLYAYKVENAGNENYYRLKMVDMDETYEYSKTLYAKTDCVENGKVTVYPNPVSITAGTLNLKFYSPSESAEIVVTDILARNIRTFKVKTTGAAWNTARLNVSDLPTGNYSLRIKGYEGSQIFIIVGE